MVKYIGIEQEYMLISTTQELEDACEELMRKNPEFIAVDTEFIRSNVTYYPKLSLIQISYGEKSFVVDVLVPGIDLSLIKKIMLDQETTKVFHSCQQDIESLFAILKCIPNPIFDTQVAAMFCHYYHDFVSYSKIVEQYRGIALDKMKAKNSDWLKRPLSQNQLDYAINDVTHLYELHQILRNKLKENNRINWFKEEMESIIDVNKYSHNPKDAWKRIKFNYELNPRLMLTVKAVSEWQETLAQRYNINRNKVVNNAVISALIEKKMDHIDDILDDLKRNTKNIKEEDLLKFIDIFNENEREFVHQDRTLSDNYGKSVFDILSIILESKCKENNISRKLISSKAELADSISGQIDKLFKGWRYDFFGKSIESFLNESSRFEVLMVRSDDSIAKIRINLVENSRISY